MIQNQLRQLHARAVLTERTRAIVAWRNAALEDGWVLIPKFPGVPWKQACTLHREGFVTLCVTRNGPGDTLTIWGPDGLQVPTPNPYNWKEMMTGLNICLFCGNETEDPRKLGDGGRACPDCERNNGNRTQPG